MTRPARVIVDTAALQANLSVVRQRVPGAKVMAIVKADGYGHGVHRVGKALHSADSFGVASIEEASKLRDNQVDKPIVLLEGPFEAGEIELIESLNLETVIHHREQVDMLVSSRCRAPIWIKIDSGMHRLGFCPRELDQVVARLRDNGNVPRFMTHLASAHERQTSSVTTQLETFANVTCAFQGERSIANSAAILAWPDAHADWVRPGIMLYGVSPFSDTQGSELGLHPAMSVQSELISVREVEPGGTVGYGKAFVCPETMPVGVVAFGYGDGYPRAAATGTPILVRDRLTQVIGQASMDMLTVDLRPIPDARVGDSVTLWGKGLAVERVAQSAGTIPYELLCRVRMRARYIEN